MGFVGLWKQHLLLVQYLDTTGQNDLCPKFTNDYGAINLLPRVRTQAFFARAFFPLLSFISQPTVINITTQVIYIPTNNKNHGNE